MRQMADTKERSLSTPTDATASTIAGGQASMADLARRLTPLSPARSPGTESWRICAAC
jgi:hypothetical protein